MTRAFTTLTTRKQHTGCRDCKFYVRSGRLQLCDAPLKTGGEWRRRRLKGWSLMPCKQFEGRGK